MQWTILKGEGSEALHRDRLRDAQGAGFRYLVLAAEAVAEAVAKAEAGEEIIGFGCLVFRRPASWSDAGDTQHLPQIVDLRVKETRRGQGYGSDFVRAMEQSAAATGYRHLYLSVEPSTNPGAFAFYRRLGYQAIQSEPYQKVWELIDSSGKVHRGEDWVVDMVKVIG